MRSNKWKTVWDCGFLNKKEAGNWPACIPMLFLGDSLKRIGSIRILYIACKHEEVASKLNKDIKTIIQINFCLTCMFSLCF